MAELRILINGEETTKAPKAHDWINSRLRVDNDVAVLELFTAASPTEDSPVVVDIREPIAEAATEPIASEDTEAPAAGCPTCGKDHKPGSKIALKHGQA